MVATSELTGRDELFLQFINRNNVPTCYFSSQYGFFLQEQNDSIFLYMLVVMAHVEFWFLGLKFSAEDIKHSGAHPSSFGVGHKGEIVRLDMPKTWSANGVQYV